MIAARALAFFFGDASYGMTVVSLEARDVSAFESGYLGGFYR